ncbi:MAG TPA: metallophosphoesterase, partial [Deltaproteobacteria bacterium]|nr:metallophosphoesterase [Deltaproteobacteria bacterium]
MRKFKGSGVFIISLIVLVIAWSTAFGFDKIKFAVIADTHMDLYGVNEMKMGAASCEIVRKTVEELNTIPDLDFVLIVGDLLLDGEPYNLDLFKTYIDNLRVP